MFYLRSCFCNTYLRTSSNFLPRVFYSAHTCNAKEVLLDPDLPCIKDARSVSL